MIVSSRLLVPYKIDAKRSDHFRWPNPSETLVIISHNPFCACSPHNRNSSARIVPLSQGLRFPCALGACQELRHVLILSGVVSPPFRSRIPAMVANSHIDIVVDQELCRFVVPADGALVQNAGWLVRAPVRINVGSSLQ